MIFQNDLKAAIESAVKGGRFMAAHLASESSELLFFAALTNFLNTITVLQPSASLSDLREAMRSYAVAESRRQ